MRVLVVGAGIGGLSAYCALRASGIDVEIFERADQAGHTMVGGGFHLWPNGVLALRELKLADTARGLGAPLHVTEYHSYTGRKLAEWPVGQMSRELDAFDVGIGRAELMQLLSGAAGLENVRTKSELVDFHEDGTGVTVRFADGREERGDMLVAADGLRSVVRAKLVGQSEPDFAGYVQWQTLIEGTHGLPEGVERVTFGPGMRNVIHGVSGGRLFWACIIYGQATDGGRPDGRKQRLLDLFRGWPEPIVSAVEATPEERITGLPIYDRKPVKAWGHGRVTLIGDAAHPMTTNTSQGGNQAIEDGVLLGRMLRGVDHDPSQTLRNFEKRRIARTTPLVKNSRFISNMNAWDEPWKVRFRDELWAIALRTKGMSDQRRAVATPL